MLSVFRNMFRIRDLRNKILFTLFIFAIYRLGAAIPVPGVDLDRVRRYTEVAEQSGFLGILNLFSGGALEQLSVFSLGIMPYITASIIMQLLAVVIPKLQSLQDEGETAARSSRSGPGISPLRWRCCNRRASPSCFTPEHSRATST